MDGRPIGVFDSGLGGPGLRTFLTSGDSDTFRRLGARFLGPEVESVEGWAWN